jgi:hypothetical protein
MDETLSVSEFKAKCLDLFDKLSKNRLRKVTVTRHGKPVAIVTAPISPEAEARSVHGSMAGMVTIPPGFDLTAPVIEDEFDAAHGSLHR